MMANERKQYFHQKHSAIDIRNTEENETAHKVHGTQFYPIQVEYAKNPPLKINDQFLGERGKAGK
jgi:hypothetical protein